MSVNRMANLVALSLLIFGLATSAQSATFVLRDGGGQVHIGNGLALPIQAAVPNTGGVFPTLLVPVAAGPAPTINATIAKTTLLTAMATPNGPVTKSGYQQAITGVPVGALSKPAAQTTVGVKFSNPIVFAVGTNLKFTWPFESTAMFSTANATTFAGTFLAFGGTMSYSNALGSRFGGPAHFRLTAGAPAGLVPADAVTVYIKINATTPACTHPLFGGSNNGCTAGLLPGARPSGNLPLLFGAGGVTATSGMTPGGPITGNNVAAVKMGLTPLGTILNAARVAAAPLPTNMATSIGAAWTTGTVMLSQGVTEMFTLTGMDSRTVGGVGTIQMVAGALSTRAASGGNANRGWVRLVLKNPGPAVPSMSWSGLATLGVLLTLAGGYTLRRRLFS